MISENYLANSVFYFAFYIVFMYSSIHFNAKPRTVTNASKPKVTEKLQKV